MKKLFTLVLTLVLALNVSVLAFAQESSANKVIPVDNISVVLKGDALDLGGKPVIIYNGSSMLPMSVIFSALDDGTGTLNYESVSKKVTINTGGKEFGLYLGQNGLTVDGIINTYEGVTPFSYLGSTYLPTSYIKDIFGLDVTWLTSTRTIILQDPALAEEIRAFVEESNAKYADTQKMSMDMNMVLEMKATGAEELDITATATSSMQVDAEAMFVHTAMSIDADGEAQDVDMYYSGDSVYMSADGGKTWVVSELPIEQVEALLEKTLSDSSYLSKLNEFTYAGYKKTTNADGDIVIEGILPINEILEAVNLGGLTDGLFDSMSIDNYYMAMTFDKDTTELKAITMSFELGMSVTEGDLTTSISVDCVAYITNIDYNPDFESVVPAEVIYAATGVLDSLEETPAVQEETEVDTDEEAVDTDEEATDEDAADEETVDTDEDAADEEADDTDEETTDDEEADDEDIAE